MSDYKVAIKIAGELEKSFGSALKGAQTGLNGLAKIGKVGAAAFGASTVALGSLAAAGIKAGIEYEQAFAGVRKTVNATEEQLAELNTGIRNMAKEMPTSAAEIAGVAEAAGQLGIKTDNILGFTKTMVMLGDSTNMAADEAATSLARLANITGMPQDSFEKLGSTIVALGNNLATTESEITAMGLRIAGAGSQVGMTEAQIMSFSAALSSVGIEAEAGGSAFSKVLVDMQLAAETGGESLQQFANVAGMSASEFKQAFENDAAGAMSSFIKGLADCEKNGQSAIKVLDDMGITEVRMRDMLLRAAGASDVFTEALEIGTAAWDENVALTNEANQRYQTMGSRLAMLKNKATDLGITFYESVNEPMGAVVDSAGDMLENLSKAFETGGLSGFVSQLGTEAAAAAAGIADASPEMVEAAGSLIESFLTGIEQNSDQIASGAADTATTLAAGIIRIAPQMITVGAEFMIEFARGISENLPELKEAVEEAVSELIEAAGNAIKEHMDFLQDDSVGVFEKIVSLLPAALAGFLAFKKIAGAAKAVKTFVSALKGTGKITASAKQIQGTSTIMSAAAKNMLGAGVGFGAAAAGLWLLADAAIRIGDAGPGAAVGMTVMAGGIIAMMTVAGTIAPKLQAGTQGLLAFGGAALMASAGMSLMAFAASQMAEAGPLALAGLSIMEVGMTGLLAVAGVFGPSLASSAAGLLAFGGAVLMASAGMSLMAIASTQIATAGPLAVASLTLMTAGMAGMLAIAGALGPSLTAGAVGLLAFGAAVIMASAGCLIMVQAATQLAAAGVPAQIAMAALAAGVLVFGAAAGALSPLLLAGAAGLAAFGAALAVVSAAALLGSAAITVITSALPMLVIFGASGAVAITQLGAAMVVFAAGATTAGAGVAVAAVGLSALAIAAAASALAMAPLSAATLIVATSTKTINSNAKKAGSGLKSMAKSAVSTAAKMAVLSAGVAPAAAAMLPFSAAIAAAAAAITLLLTGTTATAAAVTILSVGILAAASGAQMASASLVMFGAAATGIQAGTMVATVAIQMLASTIPGLSSAMVSVMPATLSAGVAVTGFGAAVLASGAVIASSSATLLVYGNTFMMLTIIVQTSMLTMQTTVQTSMLMIQTTIQATGTQVNSIVTSTTAITVATIQSGTQQMVSAISSGCAQALSISQSTANGIYVAFASLDLYGAGVNAMAGLVSGLESMRGSVMATASSIASAAASAVNAALQIHSPSRVLRRSGQFAGEGVVVGMEDMRKAVKTSAVNNIATPVEQAVDLRNIPKVNPRTSVFREIVQEKEPERKRSTQEGIPQIIFSPTYHFEGEAPKKQDIVEANRMSQREFEKLMKEYLRNHRRPAFG